MNLIESTQAELIRTKDRMLALLQATPEDRLNWKPTPHGRSILELAAHSANALGNIAMQLRGTPYTVPTSAEANETFLAHDAKFTDRAQVEQYLQSQCDEYVALLGTFREEELGKMLVAPFGLGEVPLSIFMTMGNLHTMGHIAQIEYIQTLYGDHDWHTGF